MAATPEFIAAARSPAAIYGARRLAAHGYTKEQVYGVLGSVMQESGMNPKAFNAADPNGGSIGIVQHQGIRREELEAYAARNGRDVWDYETQWDFVIEELLSTEQRADSAIRASATAGEASRNWTNLFERPHKSVTFNEKRAEYADMIRSIWTDAQGDGNDRSSGGNQYFGPTTLEDRVYGGYGEEGYDGGPSAPPGEAGTLGDVAKGALGGLAGLSGLSNSNSSTASNIGGIVGGMIAGPVGAAVGGIIGQAIGQRSKDKDEDSESDDESDKGLFGGLVDGLTGRSKDKDSDADSDGDTDGGGEGRGPGKSGGMFGGLGIGLGGLGRGIAGGTSPSDAGRDSGGTGKSGSSGGGGGTDGGGDFSGGSAPGQGLW